MLDYFLQRIVCTYASGSTLFNLRKIITFRKAARETLRGHNPLELIVTHLYPQQILLTNVVGSSPLINLSILKQCAKVLDWSKLSVNHALTPDIILEYGDALCWVDHHQNSVSTNPALTGQGLHRVLLEEVFLVIDRYQGIIDWMRFSRYQPLSTSVAIPILERYADKIEWRYFSRYQRLTQLSAFPVVERFQEKIDWRYFSQHQLLEDAPEFIERYHDKIDWFFTSRHQHLTGPTMLPIVDRYIDKIDWRNFSLHQYLSIPVIERYIDYWHWDVMHRNNSLTLEIVERYAEQWFSWEMLFNLPLTSEFIVRNFHHIPNDCWYNLSYLCLEKFPTLIVEYPEWPWRWD